MTMKKIVNYITAMIILLLILSINTFAATTGSFKVTSKVEELDINATTTITITTTNCEGQFSISSSDSSVASVSSTSEWVSGSATITVTAKKEGTATITVTATNVGDNQAEPEDVTGSQSVTIKVKPPVKEEPKKEEPVEPEEPKQPSTPTPEEPKEDPTPQKPTEPTFKNVNETVYVNQESVNVRGTWSVNGGKYGTLYKGDSVTRTGVSSEVMDGHVWSRINYNGKTAYVISSALTTTKVEVPKEDEKEKEDEEKSTNKLLKELKVEGYELTPGFNSQTTKYSLTLSDDEENDKLDITATPEDEKATVSITGNENFKVGNNIVKITVTAEDGTARIYTITVSKTNEEGVVESLKLSSLEITNATLEPSFDPEVTNYIITIEDPSTITAETILSTVEDKDVTVTTSETTPDENGEKIITIMLETKDGKKTGIYQITVKKPVVNQTAPTITNTKGDNTIYYILGGIIGAILILILIIIVALKKTSDKEDDEDIKNADELSDDYDYNLKGAIDEVNKPYDEMVEESNFKSQILNTDLHISDETKVMGNFNNEITYEEDFEPNVAPKKKGKHF